MKMMTGAVLIVGGMLAMSENQQGIIVLVVGIVYLIWGTVDDYHRLASRRKDSKPEDKH